MESDVLASARKQILFLPHAIQQMSRADRMITTADVKAVIFDGKIIELYEDDPRGRSCLMLHMPNERAVHVVCSPKEDYLAIITAYLPSSTMWNATFNQRVKQ